MHISNVCDGALMTASWHLVHV